jgi:CysZ protein
MLGPSTGPSPAAAHGPRRLALGFFAGIRAFFGGVGFVFGTPGVWGWAAVPVLTFALLLGTTGGVALWGAGALTDRIVSDPSGPWHAAGAVLVQIMLSIVGLVVAFVVAMSLAQPLSGFALEAIARKQELALGGRTWPEQGFVVGALRSLRVSLTALAFGLPVLAVLALVTLLVPPLAVVTVPLKLAVVGLLAAYDMLDYPLSIRGEGVRARLAFVRAQFPAVLGFGLSVAVVLLIPGVGLLVLPWAVAGATRLVVAETG